MFDATEAINDIIEDINDEVDVYDESCYDAIYEELCDLVDGGEMSLEDAQMILDRAGDIYMSEGVKEKCGEIACAGKDLAIKGGKKAKAIAQNAWTSGKEAGVKGGKKLKNLASDGWDKVKDGAPKAGKKIKKLANKYADSAADAGKALSSKLKRKKKESDDEE